MDGFAVFLQVLLGRLSEDVTDFVLIEPIFSNVKPVVDLFLLFFRHY